MLKPISEQEIRDSYKHGVRDFRNRKLLYSALNDIDLSGCDFSGSEMFGCGFWGTKLVGANFSGAEIRRFSFYGTPIDSAILRGASIIHCFRYESELTLKNLEEMIEKMRAVGMPTNVTNNIELVFNVVRKP